MNIAKCFLFSALLIFVMVSSVKSSDTDPIKKSSSPEVKMNKKGSIKRGESGFCGGAVKDIEGNIYTSVLIGDQCWMGENMRARKYSDGTKISKGPSDLGAAKGWTIDNGYYSCPTNIGNTKESCEAAGGVKKLGLLYQWSAAMKGSVIEGARGICPTGWHIPTDAEYKKLETYLGMSAGADMGSVDASGWRGKEGVKLEPGGVSGFGLVLVGSRNPGGSCYGRDFYTILWTSSHIADGAAWTRSFYIYDDASARYAYAGSYGVSARCIKD